MDHINNPQTRELPFPEHMKADISNWIAERKSNRPPADQPPWVILPNEPMGSMAWKMGEGEDYMREFEAWALVLQAEAFDTLVQDNPEPDGWAGFWDSLGKRR